MCGLFSFYIVHLGCINKYLTEGYIPIVDLKSFNNIYNKINIAIDKLLKLIKNIIYKNKNQYCC